MRNTMRDAKLRMILVSPSIPSFRRVLLEEYGIQCFEIRHIPGKDIESQQTARIVNRNSAGKRDSCTEPWPGKELVALDPKLLVPPVSRDALALVHCFQQGTLPEIQKDFAPYEVLPVRMIAAHSSDRICSGMPESLHAVPEFQSGGVWWAYSFGNSNQQPKNDLPNLSAVAMPWGFELTVNSELQTSQAVFRKRLRDSASDFDRIVREHGKLRFQAMLKLECQPRFYFWIPLYMAEPGQWEARFVLDLYSGWEQQFDTIRVQWIDYLISRCSPQQAAHMKLKNRKPNIALRLARHFSSDDSFWLTSHQRQVSLFTEECRRLRPLIDLLR